MAPKSGFKWCKTRPIQSINAFGLSLHYFGAITFDIN